MLDPRLRYAERLFAGFRAQAQRPRHHARRDEVLVGGRAGRGVVELVLVVENRRVVAQRAAVVVEWQRPAQIRMLGLVAAVGRLDVGDPLRLVGCSALRRVALPLQRAGVGVLFGVAVRCDFHCPLS